MVRHLLSCNVSTYLQNDQGLLASQVCSGQAVDLFSSSLHRQILDGKISIPELRRSQHAELNAIQSIDGCSWTLLGLAASIGRPDLVQALLNAGVDPLIFAQGRLALHVSCERGCLRSTKHLLDATLDVASCLTAPDAQGRTPVDHAIASNSVELVDLLVEHGAHHPSLSVRHRLLLAARRGDRATLRKLLTPELAKLTDFRQRSLLHLLVLYDQVESSDLELGVPLSTQDDEGYTPVERACLLDKTRSVLSMVESLTPRCLDLALRSGSASSVRSLLLNQVKPSDQSLSLAIMHEPLAIDPVLRLGADPHATSSDHATPTILAHLLRLKHPALQDVRHDLEEFLRYESNRQLQLAHQRERSVQPKQFLRHIDKFMPGTFLHRIFFSI